MAEINQEFNMKKIQKFEEFLKECKSEVYNTNVFKKVKLALSDDEIKAEEEKVSDLAKFLKEEAIQSLIKNLNRNEGVPTDSASLRDFFHQNGVNIRYLGYVADQIKEKNLIQMQYMIEREVIIRCVKHILNQYIRDNESDELLGALISHVFNCLFAPKDFIKKLDDGALAYKPVTLNHISQENKGEVKESNEEGKVSKKEKKKQKKEGKKNDKEEVVAEEAKQFTQDIGELLFKSPYEDIIFEASEVFMDPQISMNVCESTISEGFSLTPKKLYQ